jgi:hypothetical protein
MIPPTELEKSNDIQLIYEAIRNYQTLAFIYLNARRPDVNHLIESNVPNQYGCLFYCVLYKSKFVSKETQTV